MKKRKQFIQLLSIAVLLFAFATACDKTDDPGGDFPSAGTIKDADGNKYNTVKIGNQVWMVENLKTTSYNDGTPIPFVPELNDWKKITSGAYCNYANDEKMAETYGRLYNGYVAKSSRIAPDGWHVPNDRDWELLRTYLISNGFNYDGSKEGNKIAKSLSSKIGWEVSNKEGTPGFMPESNNSTGFSALAGGGIANDQKTFDYAGKVSFWWSASTQSWGIHYLYENFENNEDLYLSSNSAFYIRLIKSNDAIILGDVFIDSIKAYSAKIQGNINGGANISSFGLCIGSKPNLDLQNSDTIIVFRDNAISFEDEFYFPKAGEKYYIRTFATNIYGTKYSKEESVSLLPIEASYTITDIVGNVYNTVSIGDQVWTVQNLKTTKYNDGTPIPNVTDNAEWASLTTGAYCNYDNLESNAEIYGRLYNWHAVNTGNLAPKGWHVATVDDWAILSKFLFDYGYGSNHYCISKALSSKTGWELYKGGCAPGFAPENNNITGFTALPGGYRGGHGGGFYGIGGYGYWWSSTEVGGSYAYDAYYRYLDYDYGDLRSYSIYKGNGFSVRLVRD